MRNCSREGLRETAAGRDCEKPQPGKIGGNYSREGLKEMKKRYDAEGISPGGAADMLALTIFVDSLIN